MLKRIFAAAMSALFLAALSPSAATAQTTEPARKEAQAKKQAGKKRAPSPGQLAARERQKKCGAEWREAKASGKAARGMKWPQFWSQCNKRLKAAQAN
ncbi:MAG TPA: hypothetical protein VHG27_07075 [Xanthobacteraceae bacterium]|nr:hypothetical protein [Xanthobacteraceae bacterium]